MWLSEENSEEKDEIKGKNQGIILIFNREIEMENK